MKPRTRIIAVIAVGATALLLILVALLISFCGRRAAGRGAVEGITPDAPGAAITEGAPPEVKTQDVSIYQRAETEELALAGVASQIIWFDAPVDRARQVAQLVLEGPPGASGVVTPAPAGLRYHDVYVTAKGIAWVDLEGNTIGELAGSDEEQALVAALARSLTEALAEVRRVGVLVDGRPRKSLAGHVDLTRTYTGQEWPVIGGPPVPPQPKAPLPRETPVEAGPDSTAKASETPPPAEGASPR